MKSFKDRRTIIAEIKKKEIKKEEIKEKIVKTRNVFFILIIKFKVEFLIFVKRLKLVKNFLLKKFSIFFSKFAKFFKWILSFYNKCLGNISKGLNKISKKIYVFFSKNRYLILGFSFLVLGILNFDNLFFRFDKENLGEEIQKINFWPTLPFSNILVSKKMFTLGYYEQSLNFYNKANKLRNNVLLGNFNNKEFKDVEEVVLLPGKLENSLLEINLIEKNFPYSWELNLKKTELEYALSKKEELENSLALLDWLNPKQFESFEKEFQKD